MTHCSPITYIFNKTGCPHLHTSPHQPPFCNVIHAATNYYYSPSPETCKGCSRAIKPQQLNEITQMIITDIQVRNNIISKPYDFHRPGTRLRNSLDWFIAIPQNCNCGDRRETMDEWGVSICWENYSDILAWLRESALDNNIEDYSEFFIASLLSTLLWSCRE